MNHLFKKFKRDIAGVIWLAFGLFLSLALWSYSGLDPSMNSMGRTLVAKNNCGYIGAILADMIYQVFGLSAWVTVYGAFRASLFHFQGRAAQQTWLRFFIGFLLLMVVSSLGALYFPSSTFYAGHVTMGGELGRLVSRGLIKILNPIGVSVVLWASCIILFVFFTETSITEIFKNPIGWVKSSFASGKSIIDIFIQNPFKKLNTWIENSSHEKKTEKRIKNLNEKSERKFMPLVSSFLERDEKDESEDFIGEDLNSVQGVRGTISPSPSVNSEPRRKVKLNLKIVRRVENWELPKISLLEDPPASRTRLDEKEIKAKAKLLVEKLAQFDIQGEVMGIKPGPAVTMFEFKPAADVKISRITDLADDLSLALSSESVRIIAPIPGRDVVGIETSNTQREGVYLKDIVVQDEFWNEEIKLPLALGRKADGEPRIVDLRKMPHLLVAGTTGSGKSVFVVSSITGLLFRHSPKTLKLILVDPKQVDLAAFNELPHLIMPPIREAKKAVGALRWAIREMEKRYRSMSKFGARGLEAFNDIVSKISAEDLKEHEAYNAPTDGPSKQDTYYYQALPYIVIVVEEFGDLMVVDKVNVEQAVVRLAQMARACGIHLVLAMQSPRRDVVTGLIKTNIPGRISFKVASKMDSRIILDEGGAERLLARGDMLFLAPGVAKPDRHHGPFLSEKEISDVVKTWKSQGEPEYDPLALRAVEGPSLNEMGDIGASGMESGTFDDDIKDERYDEILAHVSTLKDVSASMLQRKFRLGYPRASRMIEIFESEGVVGPANGSKPRQVLIKELK